MTYAWKFIFESVKQNSEKSIFEIIENVDILFRFEEINLHLHLARN